MYAIVREDGRQYKVAPGEELNIDLRTGIGVGGTIVFDEVLAFSDGANIKVGTPLLAGATVAADVVGIEQGPKLVVQKLRRRKNMRRKTGHRQMYTRVKISSIDVP
jgi:large subunit ribosomal protein L21